jgi:hypothetical protein
MIDMSSDQSFQHTCSEFDSVMSGLRRKLTSLPDYANDPNRRNALLAEADRDILDATEILETLNVDARSYEMKVRNKAFSKQKQYKQDLNEQKQRLYSIRNNTASNAAKLKEDKEARKMLVGQANTLAASDAALDNTLNKIQEIQSTGAQTHGQLQNQTEQMKNMKSNLDDMEGSLSMSRRVILRMQRRVATSKLMSAFIILLEIGICALIVYLKYVFFLFLSFIFLVFLFLFCFSISLVFL